MATVTKYPQSSGTGWTNPTYAYSDDGTNYATLAFPKSSYTYNYYYNFAFGIPANATITEILIESEYKVSTTASTATYVMAATKGTTVRGTQYSDTTEPTTDTQRSTTNCGTWTVAELNDNTTANGFNIRIGGTRGSSNTAVTGSVDYVRATITFSENYIGVLSISNASTVSAAGKIGANGVIGISSVGTPTAGVKKGTTGILGMSAGNTVSVTGVKQEVTNDYVGVLSISDGSSVSASGKSGTYGVLQVSDGSTVTVSGGKKSFGVLGVTSSSTVESAGSKLSSGVLSVSDSSSVASSGKKSTSGVVEATSLPTPTAYGKMNAYGVVEISGSPSISVTGEMAEESMDKYGSFSVSALGVIVSRGTKRLTDYKRIAVISVGEYEITENTGSAEPKISTGSYFIKNRTGQYQIKPNKERVQLWK